VIVALTGNGNFPTPAVTLVNLQAAVTAATNALAVWRPASGRGSHSDFLDLKDKSLTLINLLKAEAAYVQTTAALIAGNDYSALFENMSVFKNSDIAFANLEGTVSDQGIDKHNLYSFRMDPSVIPTLVGAGFNILSIANNHIGDWGIPAFTDTLSRLQENELQYTGGGLTKTEAVTPTIIEKYGMKIGFLGFSDVGPNDMAAGDPSTSSGQGTPGILLASDPNFDTIVQNAAKQVDYLVVSFHFGDEYQTKHNARQEKLAHEAVDDGAKIVIGTHPHVVEDTEVYKNSYIAYSLGNLVFDQAFSTNTMQGLLLEFKLNKDGSMTVKKDTTQLNPAFQLQKLIQGKEEKVKFQTAKTN